MSIEKLVDELDAEISKAQELRDRLARKSPKHMADFADELPAELFAAMLALAASGDYEAVQQLADLANDPEGMADILAGHDDSDPIAKMFADESGGWTAAQTKRGTVMAVRGDQKLYGKAAQQVLNRQKGIEEGSVDSETPQKKAQRLKAEREPSREEARKSWKTAIQSPTKVRAKDLPELASKLQSLTRNELREMARELSQRVGGLKGDLVQRLLDHAKASHEESTRGPVQDAQSKLEAARSAWETEGGKDGASSATSQAYRDAHSEWQKALRIHDPEHPGALEARPAVRGKPALEAINDKQRNWAEGIRSKVLAEYAGTDLEKTAEQYFDRMSHAGGIIDKREGHKKMIEDAYAKQLKAKVEPIAPAVTAPQFSPEDMAAAKLPGLFGDVSTPQKLYSKTVDLLNAEIGLQPGNTYLYAQIAANLPYGGTPGHLDSLAKVGVFQIGESDGRKTITVPASAKDVGAPQEPASTSQAESGPEEGDRNAEGLVFRGGRWRREDEELKAEEVATTVEKPAEQLKASAEPAADQPTQQEAPSAPKSPSIPTDSSEFKASGPPSTSVKKIPGKFIKYPQAIEGHKEIIPKVGDVYLGYKDGKYVPMRVTKVDAKPKLITRDNMDDGVGGYEQPGWYAHWDAEPIETDLFDKKIHSQKDRPSYLLSVPPGIDGAGTDASRPFYARKGFKSHREFIQSKISKGEVITDEVKQMYPDLFEENPAAAATSLTSSVESGPQEGDRNAEGLVFRNGRWRREDDEPAASPSGTSDSSPPEQPPQEPPPQEPAEQPKQFIKITASGRNFDQALKSIKKRGGKFNSETKTWELPAGTYDDSELKLYGLQQSEPPQQQKEQAAQAEVKQNAVGNYGTYGEGSNREVGTLTHRGEGKMSGMDAIVEIVQMANQNNPGKTEFMFYARAKDGSKSTSRKVDQDGLKQALSQFESGGIKMVGPQEGVRNAEGLVFRGGRWRREDEEPAVQAQAKPKAEQPINPNIPK